MCEYDASGIGPMKGPPSRWESLLARPVGTWTAEDWTYAVIRTDDCPKSRRQVMDLLREAYPELGGQLRYVLEVWEAGYGPDCSKPYGER